MKTSSKKRKTAVKKVAKVSKKRAKPPSPRRVVKTPTGKGTARARPAGSTRAGELPRASRFFWMFAFGADDPELRPIWWDVASGGTPRIGPPHHNLRTVEQGAELAGNSPGPIALDREADGRLAGLSPKVPDPTVVFFMMSPFLRTLDDALAYIRREEDGGRFFERCTNSVLYQID